MAFLDNNCDYVEKYEKCIEKYGRHFVFAVMPSANDKFAEAIVFDDEGVGFPNFRYIQSPGQIDK